MSPPLITVLIDTYNYGRFIECAIESVLSQDFPLDQVEVLVVDDGSTDDTPDRVRRYGDRVQYFHKPNGGQASAFNFGIARARGEIVAFLDADDYWLPVKLSRVMAEFDMHPEVGLVYHRLFERGNHSQELREARFEFADVSGNIVNDRRALMSYRPQPTSTLVFRRTILQKLCPIPEQIRLQADTYITLLAPLVAAVFAVPEFLAVYTVHGHNLYASEGAEVTRERIEQRIDMRRIIAREAENWIARNTRSGSPSAVGVYLEQWRLYIESEQFALSPPGRIQFLRYQVRKAGCSEFGLKLRAINYFNALGAFVTGNHKFDADAWRLKLWRGRNSS